MDAKVRAEAIEARDWAVAAGQLGREPHEPTGIAVRCPFGYPAVLESPPLVSGRIPNPNLLYLSCPALVKAVSRVEAQGAVRRLRWAAQCDPSLRALLSELVQLYQERRALLARSCSGQPEDEDKDMRRVLRAGIGGPETPEEASCLHAYAAALLAVAAGWPGSAGWPGGESGAESVGHPGLAKRAQEVWERFLPPVGESWCSDARCAQYGQVTRRAAIDVGTISVRLLVADVAQGHLRTVLRAAEVTRLGEGLSPGGTLAEQACNRTAEVVRRYAKTARGLGAKTVVLAGTSAARESADGRDFISALGSENRLAAAVLSAQREAELTYAGVRSDLRGNLVVMDIGGGSTELITASRDIEAVSLQVGANRATERWIRNDPPGEKEIRAVYDETAAVFGDVVVRFGQGRTKRRLVGVAGTVTTLAALDAGLKEYDSNLVHRRELGLASVRRLVSFLARLTCQERAALPCVQPGRAPVLLGGAVVVLAAMETLGYDRLLVSERDLLDGLVLQGL